MAVSTKDVVKAWSEKAGRQNQYDVREVESFEGVKQTQLIDKDTGSISVAVDGQGEEALQKLLDQAGTPLADAGVAPKESTSAESKVHYTSRGVVATPSQPAAMSDPGDPVTLHMESKATPEEAGDVPTVKDPVTGGTAHGADASESEQKKAAKTREARETGAPKGGAPKTGEGSDKGTTNA